jgi:hypothetical protein
MWKFKTDIAFITIQDLSSEDKTVDGCPQFKFTYRIEDFSGCLYERILTIESLEALHPVFRVDPLIFKVIIKSKPTTQLIKDTIVCQYKFDILGRTQVLDVSIPSKTYPADSNLETLELQKTIQALKIEVRTLKSVVETLFTNSYFGKSEYSRSELEALDFHGVLANRSIHDGASFLHRAMGGCYKLEVVDKSLFDVDAVDFSGETALHKISINGLDFIKNQLDLVVQLIEAGANLDIKSSKGDKGTPLFFLCHLYCGANMKNEQVKRAAEIIELMLKKGANPNVLLEGGISIINYFSSRTAVDLVELLRKYAGK